MPVADLQRRQRPGRPRSHRAGQMLIGYFTCMGNYPYASHSSRRRPGRLTLSSPSSR